jgi:hypothetical protein
MSSPSTVPNPMMTNTAPQKVSDLAAFCLASQEESPFSSIALLGRGRPLRMRGRSRTETGPSGPSCWGFRARRGSAASFASWTFLATFVGDGESRAVWQREHIGALAVDGDPLQPSIVSTKSTIASRLGVAVPAKTKPKSSIAATLPPAAAVRSGDLGGQRPV